MIRPLAGSLLVAAGGILVSIAGFLPWGQRAAHWEPLVRYAQTLMTQDPDLPLSLYQIVFYLSAIAGLFYPMVAGTLLASSSVLGRSRAVATAFFILNAVYLSTVAAGAIILWVLMFGESQTGRTHHLLPLLAALLLAVAWFARPSRRSAKRFLATDRVNLPIALFLLAANVVLWFVLRSKPHWSVQGYLTAMGGAGLSLLGMVLRRSGST